MSEEQKIETAAASTATALETERPVDQNKDSGSAENLDSPPAENKGDDVVPSADGDDGEVSVQQGSNPIAAINDNSGIPGSVTPKATVPTSTPVGPDGDMDVEPLKKKRGRKPGSKNREKKEKPTTGQPDKNGTQQAPLDSEAKPAAVQTSPSPDEILGGSNMRWVPAANVLSDPLFSTLFPIDEETRDAIEADMRANGFNPAHALQVWEYDGKLYLVDGYTRKDAAERAGIKEFPVFVRHFASREVAFAFAVKEQTVRRNLHDGNYLNLVVLYDETVATGSTKPRAEGGKFMPKASDDAHGKSAARTGDMLGISTTKVERIRRVLAQTDETTQQEVRDGVLTIHAALKRISPTQAVETGSGAPANEEPNQGDAQQVDDHPPTNDATIPGKDGGGQAQEKVGASTPQAPTASNRTADAASIENKAKDIKDAHIEALEAVDQIETFLRNSRNQLTAAQRTEWKKPIGRILGLLSEIGVTVSKS